MMLPIANLTFILQNNNISFLVTMNIIIPLGGKGERFSKHGYKDPKPLIPVFDKCMIEYVLDNLFTKPEDHLFILYHRNLDEHAFSEFIMKKYPHVQLIPIEQDTKGAVETLFLGIDSLFRKNLPLHTKTLLLDCDTFYTQDIVGIFRESYIDMVFYTHNTDSQPIYSYIQLDEQKHITNIQEKIKISDHANTGAYAFTDIHLLYTFCQQVINNDIMMNGEPYTSCVISEMIRSNIPIVGYELMNDRVFSLGTPTAVEQYKINTFAFLFDLDGTLVITDDIYFEVWQQILAEYHIVLDKPLFSKYIQGNNDHYVLNTLLHNIDISLENLSKKKDAYFLKNIHRIKTMKGLYSFIEKIKEGGHKMCIVTNCNRLVAEEIIRYIRLESSFDFIISANDCLHGKPHPEPYRKAIDKYGISNNQCIVLEDSKSGILSGKGVNPRLLVGMETIYNKQELIHYGIDMTIPHFDNLSIDFLLQNKVDKIKKIKEWIKTSSPEPIHEVRMDDTKLKGGFIADVLSFIGVTYNNQSVSYILKYENEQENNLSKMAKRLKLYEREYYFYTDISKYVNVRVPQFRYLLRDDSFIKKGIVLENLWASGNYVINLNLNNERIEVTLKVVENMARMHSQFWNKDLKQIFPELNKSNDSLFCPFFTDFIQERFTAFQNIWFPLFNESQRKTLENLQQQFPLIQQRFSEGTHLTFVHGDIKSPNIFYDTQHDYDPVFIDWQHCAIGKGVQDLIFFVMESFDISQISSVFHVTKYYYYHKLLEYGVTDYSMDEYERDILDAICYIPFFTSVWFGTTPQDELIDKNFPFFLISKMNFLLELCRKTPQLK